MGSHLTSSDGHTFLRQNLMRQDYLLANTSLGSTGYVGTDAY